MGRYWNIQWDSVDEHVPSKPTNPTCPEDFASSFAGGHPLLMAGMPPVVFHTAIVTDSRTAPLPTMKGTLKALDVTTGHRADVLVPFFSFSDVPSIKTPEAGISVLPEADVQILAAEIGRYQREIIAKRNATFRADRINLSAEGRKLVNRFLFVQFRNEYDKCREINFSPIIIKKEHDDHDLTINSTDHYIVLSEKWVENNSTDLYFSYVIAYTRDEMSIDPILGAEAERTFFDIVNEMGFEEAAAHLLQRASPEQRALVARMAQRGQESSADAGASANIATPLPQLSEAELAEFYAHARAHPWVSRSGIAPSQHIRTVFGKWLGRGLALVHITAAQKNLSAAYSAEIGRKPENKITELIVHLHKLPANKPRPTSAKRVAELTDAEAERRKQIEREKKSRYRRKLQGRRAPP